MMFSPCDHDVDEKRIPRTVPGGPVDERSRRDPTVDITSRSARSILTREYALTCDDVTRPQFPQALLQRLIHLKTRPVLIDPVDERNIR